MLQSVMYAKESRLNISDLLDCSNHSRFPSGNGIKSEWISSLDYLGQTRDMTPSGS